jgi:NADH-quinone oxidoreductase subunit C
LRAGEVLRDQADFDLLLSCSGVDWKDRLESVYHLYSTKTHKYVALKVTAENEHSPSLTPVWPAADWHERETYDLVGIHYDGHPNLTRILMPIDWLGHPLRKDYKVDDPRLVWNER